MNFKDRQKSFFRGLSDPGHWLKGTYALVLLGLLLLPTVPVKGVEISDIPMIRSVKAATPNVVFVLDNSGSMDWELMATGNQGRYYSSISGNTVSYIFDDPGGENTYNDNWNGYILNKYNGERGMWVLQWWGENQQYYRPTSDYVPWPDVTDTVDYPYYEPMDNADTFQPRQNPVNDYDTDVLQMWPTGAKPRIDDDGVYYIVYLDPELGPNDIIVDENDPNNVYDGVWQPSMYSPEWPDGDPAADSVYHEDDGNSGYVVFRPDLPEDDLYAVFTWINCFDSRNTNALLGIRHDGTTNSWWWNQRANTNNVRQAGLCGEWVYWATYDFTAGVGWDNYAYVYHYDPDANGTTVADAVRWVPIEGVVISNAHYYTFDDVDGDGELNPDGSEQVYLANFQGDPAYRQYWLFTDANGNDLVENGELSEVASVPSSVIGSHLTSEADLQNFVNWYSYYRKRELTGKAAVARTIVDLRNVQVGYLALHNNTPGTEDSYNYGPRQPVLPIRVETEAGVIEDERETLLNELYKINSGSGTPLRITLEEVGKYYEEGVGSVLGNTSPYADTDEGGTCQHAFAIAMTDGHWNGGEPNTGNEDSGEPSPFGDSWDDTLADVAWKYWSRDLSSLADEVPTNDCDDADYQHMVTYAVSFGLTGTMVPGNDACQRTDSNGDPPVWQDPEDAQDAHRVDDLWHAAINGHGLYFSASNPDELVEALIAIFEDFEYRTASGSSAAANGENLHTGTVVFQATFDPGVWTGNVEAYEVDLNATIDVNGTQVTNPNYGAPLALPTWSARELLDAMSDTVRTMVTYNGTGAGASTVNGIPFRFNDLDTSWPTAYKDQLAACDFCPAGGWIAANNLFFEDLVNWFRGRGVRFDSSNTTPLGPAEGFNDDRPDFRIRASKLGDIVSSAPVLVGDSLFVGANDGGLHVYDATIGQSTSGQERFVYIPGIMVGKKTELVEIPYNHKFFVDATPVVRKIDVTSGGSTTDHWLLVGGFAAGGKGFYALDITNADTVTPGSDQSATVSNMVLWEYPNLNTAPADPDIGLTYARPFIARTRDPAHEWVVIAGNGYNSERGAAVLYILDALTGAVIKKIDTGDLGQPLAVPPQFNGFSTTSVVDVDVDGYPDYAYAGDLDGNMWKFDLNADNISSWDVAYSDSGGTAKPLFEAGPDQPITTKPDVMFHCKKPGYIVVFGTGQFLSDEDRTLPNLQSIYGIWDYGDDCDNSEYLGSIPSTSNSSARYTGALTYPPGTFLLRQYEELFVPGGSGGFDNDLRVLSQLEPDWTTATDAPCSDTDSPITGGWDDPAVHVGWFFDFPNTPATEYVGERVVVDPLIRDGRAIVISFTPNESRCAGGGVSMVHLMDACSGGRMDGITLDTNKDSLLTEADLVNDLPPTAIGYPGMLQPPTIIRLDGKRERLIFSTSEHGMETLVIPAERRGFFYWQEKE